MMKKITLASITFALILFASLTTASIDLLDSIDFSFSPTVVHAVELNIGEAAKDAAVPGTAEYDPADGQAGFGLLLGRILNFVLTIGALLVLLNLIWGAILWITSGGDKGKMETARNRITQSLIGLIVLASTVALFVLIQTFLGLEVFTFTPAPSP